MDKLQHELVRASLTPFFENSSIRLFYSEERKLGVAEALSPYMPMNDFMQAFKRATEMVKEHDLKYFVFDKRSLRAFHQPSMEWYFVHWKPQVRELGLTTHYKILPEEEWFRKCVEAGRKDISDQYGEELLEGIEVHYAESFDKVFEHLGGV